MAVTATSSLFPLEHTLLPLLLGLSSLCDYTSPLIFAHAGVFPLDPAWSLIVLTMVTFSFAACLYGSPLANWSVHHMAASWWTFVVLAMISPWIIYSLLSACTAPWQRRHLELICGPQVTLQSLVGSGFVAFISGGWGVPGVWPASGPQFPRCLWLVCKSQTSHVHKPVI